MGSTTCPSNISYVLKLQKPVIKESLFVADGTEIKLDRLSDVLQILEKHVDFSALVASIGIITI